jgi:hypothetical protein
MTKSEIISAQVIMPPATGKLDRETPITTETISVLRPAPQKVARVRSAFEQAGFEVSELYGISFSITAPLKRFEEFFKVKLEAGKDGVQVVSKEAKSYELPLNKVPANLRDLIDTVTFSAPPDFGPTNF